MTIEFSLTAQLPSGKNQIQISARYGRIVKYPNARFVKWRAEATTEIARQLPLGWVPITKDLCLTVSYRPLDRRTRDVSGILDALFHVLSYSRVIQDDRQVVVIGWNPDRRERTTGPCMIFSLEELTEEQYADPLYCDAH